MAQQRLQEAVHEPSVTIMVQGKKVKRGLVTEAAEINTMLPPPCFTIRMVFSMNVIFISLLTEALISPHFYTIEYFFYISKIH